MKRTLIAALVLACAAVFGCPKVPADLTVHDAIGLIDSSLGKMGIDAQSDIQDVDGNGRIDYYLVVSGEKEDMSDTRLGWVLGGVTGVLREVQKETAWQAEKAYLEMNGSLYRADMEDLYACEGMKSLDEGYCIIESWKPANAPGYGMIDSPGHDSAELSQSACGALRVNP